MTLLSDTNKNLSLTLLAYSCGALLLLLLIKLGIWQLQRADEKQMYIDQLDRQGLQDAIGLHQLFSQQHAVDGMRVKLNGFFNEDKILLLDNQVFKGQVGYQVFTPFTDSTSGLTLLVDIGWIAAPPRRELLPAMPALDDRTQLTGSIYHPRKGFEFGLRAERYNTPLNFPIVMQSIYPEQLSNLLQTNLLPFVVRSGESWPRSLQRAWAAVNMSPQKHQAYAVQWFGMALVLALLIAHVSYRYFRGARQ